MQTYHEILVSCFEERRNHNPSYSVRAFARDLGLEPSHLYAVLALRTGLSLRSARKIVEKLPASVDKELFIDLVESEHGRSAVSKASAKRRLSRRAPTDSYAEMPLSHTPILKHWFVPALLEVITMKPDGTITEFSEILGITPLDAKGGIEILEATGIIKAVDGAYERNVDNQYTKSKSPNQVLRNFHKQIAQLCIDRMDIVPISDRNFNSAVLSFNSSRLAEACEFLERNYDEFLRRFCGPVSADDSVILLTHNLMRIGSIND